MLVSQLLVSGCFGAEVEDTGQDVPLCPLEAAMVESAGPKRRRDFALGRFCAHAALARMDRDAPAIAIGAAGAPAWPAGIIGSITHTRGYAAAVAASRDAFSAIGIDAERVGGVAEALMPRLFGTAEREWLMAQDAEKRAVLLTVFFSAKEAFYKAFGGQAVVRMSLQDIHVEMQGEGFSARHEDRMARGRLAMRGGLVVTVVTAP